MKVKTIYKVLFILVVALAAYFPAISKEVNTVDDVHIINAYGINGHRTLQDILLPNHQFYYRPLIELTYFADNYLWALDPSFMHLENVLFHALNIVLVFFLATKVSKAYGGLPGLPVTSSLLFALHPVNTEAVSWIAGRTDVLAASFVLISVLFLLSAVQTSRRQYVIASVVAMLFGCLVKETSIMLLPVSLIMIFSLQRAQHTVDIEQNSFTRSIVRMHFFLSTVFCACVALSFYWRPVTTDSALYMAFHRNYNITDLFALMFRVTGFYFKKLFFPYPLNFAIHVISSWYVILGMLVLLLCAYLLYKRELLSSLLSASLLFAIPAIVAAAAGVNWTPAAERYLYIPTAFLSIGISGMVLKITTQMHMNRWQYATLGSLFLPLAYTTFERNLLWRDNLALYSDTVRKSPGFGDIHNELGIALLKKGKREEAEQHFKLAEQLSQRPLIKEFARMNLLGMALESKSPYERKDKLVDYITEREYVPPDLLKLLRSCIQEILLTEKEKEKRAQLMQEMVALNERLYRDIRDPVYLYNNGQLMLEVGSRKEAIRLFRQAAALAPSDAYYLASSRKLVERLQAQ